MREKIPCEYCNNTEYHEAVYRDGLPFCSTTCRTLWREEQEKKRLQNPPLRVLPPPLRGA